MEEIAPSQNKSELNLFKEDILSLLRQLENKLNNQISNKESKLNKDYDHFISKINSLIENNKEMVNDLVSQKLKLEKINELETFKNKVDSMLITHEVRIKNSLEDIEKMKTKYDKIITENLFVSGFIGNSCQFKNLSEYLSYNISEVSKLKMEREQYKKDIKEIKNKIDTTVKNMITLNDNSVKLCNKYTDNKQEEFRKLLESTQTELNQKSMEMRAMIVQYNNESNQKVENIKNEFNKILEMKEEFINLINDKYEIFEKKHEELKRKAILNDENIQINKDKLENTNEQINNLEKSIKELSFQVRNYYCVSNKLAGLLEQLGANPSKSEIAKLLLGVPVGTTNTINNESKGNKILTLSVSPQPKRPKKKNSNLDVLKIALDESAPNIKEVAKKKGLTKSVFNFSSKAQNLNIPNKNGISLKRVNFKGNFDSDSENSSIILDDTIKKEEIKNDEGTKENIKMNTNLKPILKQNIKVSNIKQNNNQNINPDIKTNTKQNPIENTKVNTKEITKEITKKLNIENTKENVKDINKKNNLNNNNKNENNKDNKKENSSRVKENIIKDSIKSTTIKEKNNTPRAVISTNKQIEKQSLLNSKIQKLPLLTVGSKEHSSEEVKIINLSSGSIDKIKEKNKKNLIMIINNDNKNKNHNHKNGIKQIDLEIEHDKQACKIVDLTLPENTVSQPVVNIVKKQKKINDNGKYDSVNALINEYRAKLFSKGKSPDSKIDIPNDILDIPKKVTQAFGRTTYAFYFKKDAIDCANANKNINNFGYNGPKRGYKFQNKRRIDTGSFKASKNNFI